MDTLSPLEANRIWVERLDIRFAQELRAHDCSAYDLKIEPKAWKDASGVSYKVRLAFALRPREVDQCCYSKLDVAIVGVFTLPSDTDEAIRRNLIPLNCYVILYGFARGLVAQVTGLNPGGPFLLPAVNFMEVLRAQRAPRRKALRSEVAQAQ
ncbi:MAG: protein-export chaperone SecB [Armatimonadetes bacterium]|nr:protein-export chaperone SecB [Armatimonadota bacterium]